MQVSLRGDFGATGASCFVVVAEYIKHLANILVPFNQAHNAIIILWVTLVGTVALYCECGGEPHSLHIPHPGPGYRSNWDLL